MAWSAEHRAFIVEQFIKNGGSRDDIGWPPLSPDLSPPAIFDIYMSKGYYIIV
jgi:hypothetical protein